MKTIRHQVVFAWFNCGLRGRRPDPDLFESGGRLQQYLFFHCSHGAPPRSIRELYPPVVEKCWDTASRHFTGARANRIPGGLYPARQRGPRIRARARRVGGDAGSRRPRRGKIQPFRIHGPENGAERRAVTGQSQPRSATWNPPAISGRTACSGIPSSWTRMTNSRMPNMTP